MSEKLIIFILLVVYLARPKQPDEIQISGEMKSGCFYRNTKNITSQQQKQHQRKLQNKQLSKEY